MFKTIDKAIEYGDVWIANDRISSYEVFDEKGNLVKSKGRKTGIDWDIV